MPFNIQSFLTNVKQQGYLKNNFFDVLVQLDSTSVVPRPDNAATPGQLKFRIDGIKLPETLVHCLEVNRYGVGRKFPIPISTIHTETTLSIICDSENVIWPFFVDWKEAVFSSTYDNNNNFPLFVTRYLKEITGTVQVNMYDSTGVSNMNLNMYDCFPMMVTNPQLSWGGHDDLYRIGVTFQCGYYTINDSPTANIQGNQIVSGS